MQVRRLGVELQPAGRLVVAAAQPGRGGQEGRGERRARRSRTAAGRPPRPRRRPRPGRARSRRTPRCRWSRPGRPSRRRARYGLDQRRGVVGRAGGRGRRPRWRRTRAGQLGVGVRLTGPDTTPERGAVSVRARSRSRHSLRECIWPLVVRLLAAQRRFASVRSSPITTQPSAVDSASACSTSSWIRPPSGSHHRPPSLHRVQYVDAAEQRGRAAVRDRRDLARLALAAVERTAQQVGLRAADGLHRAPEVGGGGLVGDVAQLAGQLAVARSGRTAGR